MNVVLWVVSGLLAAVYLAAGGMKLSTPRKKLLENPNLGWTENFSDAAVKGIGAVEILGALGLILPWAFDILRVLTPVAAIGLVIVQIGAIIVHVRHKQTKTLPVNAVLLLLAAFVAVGRFTS